MNNLTYKSKYLLLAWLSLIFTAFIIGLIGAFIQGDPEPFILKLGFSDFAIFAIFLHSAGMLFVAFLLKRQLNNYNYSINIFFNNSFKINSIIFILIAVFIAFILYPVIEHLMSFVSIPMYWGTKKDSHLIIENNFSLIVTLLSAVFISPITEEIIFRGFLYNFFTSKNYNRKKSIILSITIFVSVHIMFGPGMMIYILFWSFIPFYLFLKYKSLYPSIIFHIINNFIAYIVLPLLGY